MLEFAIVMVGDKKNRTIMCSDEDWEQIKFMAEEANVSVRKFFVDQTTNRNNDSENIERILNYVRLLAYDRMDVLYEKLNEKKMLAFILIVPRANSMGLSREL